MLPSTLSWLDIPFVQKMLQSSENDKSIKVTNLTLSFATEPGDNYLSDLIRASVEYSNENSIFEEIKRISLIIKIEPDVRKDLSVALGCYIREIEMMKTTLVEMNKLLNEEGVRLCARVLYTDNGSRPLIVMEDLAACGFRLADRILGLDLDHCIVVMRGLAMFHASSVALWEKDPKHLASYTKGVFHKDYPQTIEQVFIRGFKVFANEILNWPELGANAHSYSDKFMQLSEVCYQKAAECVRPKVADFNVLNHGDCWTNNILFRYDNAGKVVNNVFVDFQMSYWTSPAMDIINFASTSLSDDVELHHKHALLEEYLKTLTKTMTRLCCKTKAPNMEDLKKSLRDHEFLEVVYSCVYLPMAMIPKSAAKTIDEDSREGNIVEDASLNPTYKRLDYRRKILRRLPGWNSSGLLGA